MLEGGGKMQRDPSDEEQYWAMSNDSLDDRLNNMAREEEEEESEDEGIFLDSSYEDIMDSATCSGWMSERLVAAEMQICELQRQLDFSTAIYLLLLLLLQNQQSMLTTPGQ